MPKRSSPAVSDRATTRLNTTTGSHHAAGTVDSIRLYRRQDGFSAPTAEERTVAQAAAVLKAAGYGIAMRCLDCGHPITSSASLARLRGPKCAAKAVADD
ncbi:MAG TPA: hypothetical protein PLK19_18090 [Mycobacterium sp.]|nr:hypothetical protein [Mycobacterium sp.]